MVCIGIVEIGKEILFAIEEPDRFYWAIEFLILLQIAFYFIFQHHQYSPYVC